MKAKEKTWKSKKEKKGKREDREKEKKGKREKETKRKENNLFEENAYRMHCSKLLTHSIFKPIDIKR